MPMAAPPVPDWLRRSPVATPTPDANVHQGTQVSSAYGALHPETWGQMAPEAFYGQGPSREGGVEAVPFGSLLDPVSQAAFLAAPGVQALARQVLPQAGMSAPRLPLSFLAQQRGNLGRPPTGARLGTLPDVAPGMQRLYRGETTAAPADVPAWITGAPQYQAMRQASGRWWTDDPGIAQWYVTEAGPAGRLVYQDVPSEVASGAHLSRQPAEVTRYSRDPAHEYYLPESYRGQGRAVPSEMLPESMVRDEAGNLQRLYHGTTKVFPDFDLSHARTGAGGDLYGPGIYMTESPEVAAGMQGYVTSTLPGGHGSLLAAEHAGKTARAYRTIASEARAQGDTGRAEAFEQMAAGQDANQARFIGDFRPNARPVYADLKRPFDMDEAFTLSQVQQMTPPGHDPGLLARYSDQNWTGEKVYNYLRGRLGDKEAANAHLQALGYDGITHIGGGNTGGQSHRVFIAFSPDSVYPSFNVDALRPPQ